MKQPSIIEVDGNTIRVVYQRNGRDIVGSVHDQVRRPTLAEARAVMVAAIERKCIGVTWYGNGDNQGVIRRCQCGEVTIGDIVCKLCRALAPLVASTDYNKPADLQARYEAADRYMDRVAAVISELKRQIDKRTQARMEEAGGPVP